MSDRVTGAHLDERFDAVESQIRALDQKIDTNASAAEARFRVLESRLPGHSEEQIIELIDERLQAVLPDMLREAVNDGLSAPLKELQPLMETMRTINNLRSFWLWLVPVLSGVVTVGAVITIAGAVL